MKKEEVFSSFIQKASKRLEDKKKGKKATLYIPSMDTEITIRNLTNHEFLECVDDSDGHEDVNYGDKYMIYLATIEPNLKEVAKNLKEQGEIKQYIDVCDIFEAHEIRSIANEITKLSGIVASGTNQVVRVVNELKN